MDLYVLRHAIAVDREDASVPRDRERPLTAKGIAKLRKVIRGMKGLGLSFDLILASPYVRALETAELVADELGSEAKVERTPHLAPDGNPRTLIDLIASRCGERSRILVVGHEPYLSQLISVLLVGDGRTAITLKKAGLCKLAMQTPRYGRCAILEWLLTPAQAEKLR
jgi:phosphohistidine phosphatase